VLGRGARNKRADFLPQLGDVPGEFVRPRRRFAAPEWHVRCRSRGVLHENFSGLHAAYAPGSVSQQHDVSGKALDGEVFVHGANDRAFRMRYDGIQRVFRDGPAAGDGRKTAAPARTDHAIHPVAMQIRSITAASACNSFRKHFDNLVKIGA